MSRFKNNLMFAALAAALGILSLVTAAFGQATSAPKLSKQFDIAGTKAWTDTGINVAVGERVVITSDGQLRYQQQFVGPEGAARGWRDLLKSLPVNSAGTGALIGRIGDDPAVPFVVGTQKEIVANRSGRLFLGVNLAANETGEGNYKAQVQIFIAATNGVSAATTPVAKIEISPEVLKQIPRRIGDQQGNPGDMVNFMIVGSREALSATFQAAGWNQADRTKKDAVLNAIVSSLSKSTYLAMPMSELYLFGRVQDFGFEHAEPVQMVAQRHHLRIWKAPTDVNGQTLWVGAATHDIGFERDQRNNGVTHKIDPQVDKEREFVSETLNATGDVAALSYVTPPDPVTEAHTATGGTFTSDGRILVIQLK